MQPSKSTTLSLMTLAALAAGVPAVTSAAGFYLGAGALGSELEPRVSATSFTVTEPNSSGARIFAGFDLSRRFSMEGYYSQLGAATLSNQAVTGEIDYKSAGVAGLYYLYSSRGSDGLQNREGLMLYGKAGLGFLSNESSNNILFNRLNGEHLAAGVGVEYNFSNGFGLRAEFLNHDADARDLSINLVKRFGSTGVTAAPIAEPKEMLPVEPEEVVPEEIVPPESVVEPMVETDTAPVEAPVELEQPEPEPAAAADSDADGVSDDIDLCANTLLNAAVDENGCVFSGVLDGVNFDSGSAALTKVAAAALDNVIVELSVNPELFITVLSHTDNRGDATSNMELSRQRAVTVVRYLSDVGGIDLSRMDAVGYGESRPLETNQSTEGRAANRRVEIEINQQ